MTGGIGKILGYFKNGQFRGFGAEPPTAGGLAGSRDHRPRRGSSGRIPFASLSLLIADFSFKSRD